MKKVNIERCEQKQGFTLVEIMVVAGISMILVAGIISATVSLQRDFKAQNSINEMQQNVRAAMDIISRDLRTAGYGLDDDASASLTDWITWIGGFDSNPKIIEGGTGPDTVYVAGAFAEPIGYSLGALELGDTVIVMDRGGDQVNTSDKKVIVIGHLETARVISNAGNTLTISTHPTDNVGLAYSFEAGAPVEVVSVITYQVVNNPSLYPYGPHLQRIDSTTEFPYDWQRMAAGNIENMQITADGTAIDIEIQGRSARPEYLYTDPNTGDHYRRYRLSTTIRRRN